MPMGRKQKETVELRFYEIPQGEPVLALLGEEWNRVYGHDNFYLHFHNLMEIGICRKGEGELIINEHTYTYTVHSFNRIPQTLLNVTFNDIRILQEKASSTGLSVRKLLPISRPKN